VRPVAALSVPRLTAHRVTHATAWSLTQTIRRAAVRAVGPQRSVGSLRRTALGNALFDPWPVNSNFHGPISHQPLVSGL